MRAEATCSIATGTTPAFFIWSSSAARGDTSISSRGWGRAGEDEGGERYAEGSWHSHPHELRAVAKNLGSAADPRCAPSSVDGRAVAVIVVPGRLGDCPGGTGEKQTNCSQLVPRLSTVPFMKS